MPRGASGVECARPMSIDVSVAVACSVRAYVPLHPFPCVYLPFFDIVGEWTREGGGKGYEPAGMIRMRL